jgi:hypothetical protein
MTIQELHIKAIELADLAFIKRFNGLFDEAKVLFKQAFELEKTAAQASIDEKIGEPSISVLLKSAASLAINAEEFKDAEKLICLALYGEPPFEIAEELRNLMEDLNFHRHLKLQGVSLGSTELQLVIAGNGIGYGMAKSELIFDRINIFEKLTFRTVERKSGKQFRASGDVSKAIKINFQPYLSVPRAASFAFTIRLGGLTKQMKLEGFENSVEIVEDIVENIELVNSADFENLRKKIPDNTYYKNFVALSKELAPDGDDVSLVGLSIIREGKQKDVQFTRVRSEINATSYDNETNVEVIKEKNVELTGRLFAADEDKNNIRLRLEDASTYSVTVPDGLGDIVKKYWGEQVKIKGVELRQKVIRLTDIDPA